MPRRMKTEGFLLAECNRLAGVEKPTKSLAKLARAAARREGVRAREYVELLAVERGQLARLAALAREGDFGNEAWAAEIEAFAAAAAPFEGDAEGFLEASAERLGNRYAKVLDLMRAPQAHADADTRAKGLMRDKIVAGLEMAGKTPYAMMRDLGLNKGNAYAFLRGDTSKVSRATARRMLEYTEALAAQ